MMMMMMMNKKERKKKKKERIKNRKNKENRKKDRKKERKRNRLKSPYLKENFLEEIPHTKPEHQRLSFRLVRLKSANRCDRRPHFVVC